MRATRLRKAPVRRQRGRSPLWASPAGVRLALIALAFLIVLVKLFGSHTAQSVQLGGSNSSSLPPEQLAEWREYAIRWNCSLDDDDYSQIFEQLAPFRAAGGISEGLVRRAYEALEPNRALGSIRYGQLSWEGEVERFSAQGYLMRVLPALAHLLPDMTFVVNLHDEPRSWVAPLPPNAEAALADGSLTARQAWAGHACDGAGLGDMKRRHGFLATPHSFRAVRELLPVLSPFTVPGCFADILIPYPWNHSNRLPEDIKNATLHSGCPLSNNWGRKYPVAFWRGTTTGAHYDESIPKQGWQDFHRQRLVNYSRQHPDILTAAFTGIVQCSKAHCADMERAYGTVPRASYDDMNQYKYLMVVDGNAGVDRLAPALCTGSLVLLAGMVRQWFEFRLKPHQHYLPVKLDYSDLADQVKWAREHDEQAAGMATAAAQLVNTKLRSADARCYTYRLMLEYGALYRPSPSSAARGGGREGGLEGMALEDDPLPLRRNRRR